MITRTPPVLLLISASALAAFLTISGCAPLKTTRWDEGATAPKNGVGQFYFLPKARITITGNQPKEGPYQLTVVKDLVPDKSSRYFVAHTGNWMYEDSISLGVNSDGLLDGDQKADVKDKLPDTITTLADTLVSAWKITSTGGLVGADNKLTAATPFSPFQISFSPGDDITNVNRTLEKAGFHIVKNSDSQLSAPVGRSPKGGGDSGLLYRPPTVYRFTLKSLDGYEIFSRETTISIPNPAEVAVLPMKRMGFVDITQKGTFESGQLKRVDITQPSPVLGVVSIPNKILGSVANAIGGIFDNRAKARTDEKATALAQSDLALARLKAEKDLADAQKALNPPTASQTLQSSLEQEVAIKKLRDELNTLNAKLDAATAAAEAAKKDAFGNPAQNAGGTAGAGPVVPPAQPDAEKVKKPE